MKASSMTPLDLSFSPDPLSFSPDPPSLWSVLLSLYLVAFKLRSVLTDTIARSRPAPYAARLPPVDLACWGGKQ